MPQPAPVSPDSGELAPPPSDLEGVSLFLDFDGTLVDLAPTPDAVTVTPALLAALGALADRLPGRIAIVSGRSLDQIDGLLGPFARGIAVAGSHGAEQRHGGADPVVPAAPAGLAHAARELADYAERSGLVLERKTLGVALHYRQQPSMEAAAVAAATALAERHGLVLQRGKMMVELRTDGDKGRAIAALLASRAMADTRPLFFGDDLTDEDGFVTAAAAGGAGVLVGEPRPTAARYRLPDVAAVMAWIDAALTGQPSRSGSCVR